MTEQELREKIARIIAKHLCKNRYSHFQLYGDSANCYSRENFAECEAVCNAVDELIAANIGEVTAWKDKATAAELVAQAAANTAIERIEDYKHRADVYSRALHIAHTAGEFAYYVEKAEKELAEEKKDD